MARRQHDCRLHQHGWYEGWAFEGEEGKANGMTLLESRDFIVPPQQAYRQAPQNAPPGYLSWWGTEQDACKISGIGTVPMGRVKTGIIKPGQVVTFAPVGLYTVEMHHKSLPEATPGDNVGFKIKNMSVKDVKSGYVTYDSKNKPATLADFNAQDIFLNHTTHIACKFVEILEKFDSHTGKSIEDVPKFIKSKYAAIVKLFPSKPMWVESFSEFPPLGRFSARDMRQTSTATMAWRRPLTLTLTLTTSPRRVSSCPSSPK